VTRTIGEDRAYLAGYNDAAKVYGGNVTQEALNRMEADIIRIDRDALRAVCAEVVADMRNSIAHDGYRTVSTRCAPYTMVEEWESRLKQVLEPQP